MSTLRYSACAVVSAFVLAATLLAAAPAAHAQAGSIPERIEATYALTKPTADLTSIVKPGDVLVLNKDDLFMCAISSAIPSYNTYKGGKLHQSFLNKMKFFTASGNAPTVPTRMFVAGEKVLLTGVEMKDDGVQLSLLSEMIDGLHYKAFLVLPFAKGSTPSADEVMQSLAQVISVQPASHDAPAEAPVSRTLAVGQTKQQVQAILGQPTTVVQLGGGKEIDYFPTMKVTFTGGRVTDVQ
ncbi:outer membrane protein assembly factor BamE [Rhodanobacter sp. AS-Z3]|uniref:outer membrane protein assembly factor BamE domain-containing protein n=1 Tax=Rhodanobacter sp. AS-Z3 TaxID=3031330 RepID=UPI002479D725|nr:outer membrane protein assembly factor BamE [Rhodanobacter sp. AS-Z3]WEN14239.1 outer membrane protein assembly factor BamE [Rhodanobacter sp. AS-Z3]